MANEKRVRADGVAGALSSGLAAGATAMNSAALADLPVVDATNHAAITIFTVDGNGRFTAREVVYVTAHTAAATSATVLRGQEGTSDRTWASGAAWAHGPTTKDHTGSGVKVTNSTGQTVLTGTTTTLTWNTEEHETDAAYHSTSSNTDRLLPPTPGLYIVGYSLAMNPGTSVACRVLGTVQKNGAGSVAGSRCEKDIPAGISGGAFPTVEVTVPMLLVSGDYVTVNFFQNTGSSQTVDAALSAFWMFRLGFASNL